MDDLLTQWDFRLLDTILDKGRYAMTILPLLPQLCL